MSCEKIAYLIDKGEIEELSGRERRKMKFHFMMCKLCKRYQDDSKALSRMFKRLADKSESRVLKDSDKDRLKGAIAENS